MVVLADWLAFDELTWQVVDDDNIQQMTFGLISRQHRSSAGRPHSFHIATAVCLCLTYKYNILGPRRKKLKKQLKETATFPCRCQQDLCVYLFIEYLSISVSCVWTHSLCRCFPSLLPFPLFFSLQIVPLRRGNLNSLLVCLRRFLGSRCQGLHLTEHKLWFLCNAPLTCCLFTPIISPH